MLSATQSAVSTSVSCFALLPAKAAGERRMHPHLLHSHEVGSTLEFAPAFGLVWQLALGCKVGVLPRFGAALLCSLWSRTLDAAYDAHTRTKGLSYLRGKRSRAAGRCPPSFHRCRGPGENRATGAESAQVSCGGSASSGLLLVLSALKMMLGQMLGRN